MKELKKNTYIAVIGGGNCTSDVDKLAEEVGIELAKRKAVLICGGLGGVMEATCRGARSEGGLTIGVLPGSSREEANPYVQIPIVTGIGYARNIIVVKSAQAVIAINGEYGTLTEISFALHSGIPVVGLNTWNLSLYDEAEDLIIRANDARDAVVKAINAAVSAKSLKS
jgi:uncharacterized protein (TIGR00725 family)